MSDLFPEVSIDPIADARRIFAKAIEVHKPSSIWVGFSGGSDSLAALELASELPGFRGALHLDTTIKVPETQEFVRETCKRRGFPLKIYTAPVPYDDLVIEHGFPGPYHHTKMYNRLKERSLRRFIAEFKTHLHDRVMIVTGVRKSESRRRMATTEEISREGCRLWCAPMTNWTTEQKHQFIAEKNIRENPIAKALCMSGECLCGSFARPEELAEIEAVSPAAAKHIKDLTIRVRAAGKWWKWGHAPPSPPDPRQITMNLAMCHSCLAKTEAA